MRPNSLTGLLALTVALAVSVANADTADDSQAAAIAQHGDAHGTPPCASCHGQAGEGNAAGGFPRLAGLPAAYLDAQLNAFADGTRQSPVMGPLARGLSAPERLQLAAYYAALPAPTTAPRAATVQLDNRLALHGRWDEQIPACVQCHGENGSGVGSRFPPLTAQSSLYIANQLHAWKQGTRRGDPLGLMQTVAGKLSDADIRAVSDYFVAQQHTAAAIGAVEAAGSPSTVSPHEVESRPAPTAPGMTQRLFTPPEGPIPDSEFGKVAEQGRRIFEDPAKYASQYVGNDLTCSNCHLDAGRQAGSAPLWAAYVSYPAYRAKNHHVNTFEERLQGCFRYSMNGKAPPLGDPVLVALESYAYWMAQGAPLTPNIAGRGYSKPAKPALTPDYQRGARVYAHNCALCHGDNGEGQRANNGSAAFPALWGPDSFNWGAGMGSVANAAGFIKANMPLGRGGTLGDQDAWDLALYMDSHERPQDPRYTGSVAETRGKFHDDSNSMYGTTVNGHVLGSDSVPPGPRPRRAQ